MLSTNLRTTRTLDPCTDVTVNPVAGCARRAAVTAASYRLRASQVSVVRPSASTVISGITTSGSVWAFDGHNKTMPKIHLRPDRWPLHSTS